VSKRTAWLIGVLVLAALIGEWAALRYHYGGHNDRSPLASVECHATNGEMSLAPGAVRVLVYPSERPWELVAEGAIEETLRVSPGRYDIRLLLQASADQQSEWFRDIELAAGDRFSGDARFSAGELSITSGAATGSEEGQLVVYVFAPEDHDQIITSLRPSEAAVLSSGTYDLRAVLSQDSEERGVLWLEGVKVEASVRTTREIRFRRGRLITIARNAGELLSSEAVALTVHAAGDEQEEVVELGRGGVPLSLPPGQYDVHATFVLSNDKASRWLRGLEIIEGETLEREVDFASGSIVVDAELSGGERLSNFEVYVYYYRVGAHGEPVTYTPAGEVAILEGGSYDVRVHFFRSHDQPNAWFRGVAVEAGAQVQYTATFRSGRLLVRALDADGQELIGDDVFLYVHDAGGAGERSRPIVVARSGEELILSEGLYDLRLEDTRSLGRSRWLKGVTVEAGERNALVIDMAAGVETSSEPR
jgi:hypothetical protein